ncbi:MULTISPECIES: hypothetical protein [Clostridia]|uniref:hypothetical protein n=1 Tax=Clostridia TaxID=186801 RepID=UPI000E4C1B27|nr:MULTISPECIES: hypothetical protein [Clostridia]RHV70202.1 hypothetical protein DXB15_07840 [Roseburia sp. OM02-15]
MVKKEELSIGQALWWAVDDRPVDGCSIQSIVVTSIDEDHYIANLDDDISLWLDYEELELSLSTTAVFLDKSEAEKWLRERKYGKVNKCN